MRRWQIWKRSKDGMWIVLPDTYLVHEFMIECASFEEARQFD